MKKKICGRPGCTRLIDSGERYCREHTVTIQNRKPYENAVRTNAPLYNTVRWRKLRNRILKEYPYCFKCGIGKQESSLHVHHIIEPRGNEDLFFDESNLVSVCEACHRVLTAKEIQNRKEK
jgi:5-methylcytosine-specific restriction endonuclease McrA